MKRWLKRIGLGIVALLAIALVVGSGYETMARRAAAKNYPAPGKLVDIGGRKIQLDCRGAGSPIVVLEAGLDMNGSMSWTLIHDSIAATTRTCAYSRAGVMWSDDKPGPQSAGPVATDLHATLAAAGEKPPYVMVGHSLGGPYIMTFTRLYPAAVAGLVFVDASHPDQVQKMKPFIGNQQPSMAPMRAAAALAWTGLPRMVLPTGGNNKVPEQFTRVTAAYAPTSIAAALREQEALDTTMAEAGALRQLGDRPLVVLTAMAPYPAAMLAQLKMSKERGAEFQATWRGMHDDEASWSSRSEHILVPDATHYIQIDRPDIVIAAVRKVVGMVRSGAASDTAVVATARKP